MERKCLTILWFMASFYLLIRRIKGQGCTCGDADPLRHETWLKPEGKSMTETSLTISQRISSEKTGVMRTWAPQSFWYLKCQNTQIHCTKHPLKCPWKWPDVGRILQRVPPFSAQENLLSTGGSWLRQNNKLLWHVKKTLYSKKRQIRCKWNRRGRKHERKQRIGRVVTTLAWQRQTMNEQTWYPAIPCYYESPYFCCSSPF